MLGGQILGSGGGIKSIQRGAITMNGVTSATATISSIDTTQARLKRLGGSHASGNTVQAQTATRLAQTNATTVTANMNTSEAADHITSYEVIEDQPGGWKSMQRGTVGGNTTATISSVNTAKTELDNLGFDTTNGAMNSGTTETRMTQTNATTITTVTGAGDTRTNGYQAGERYA